ncbi:sigma-54 interaction domain-containing protein [Clostridium sp.]|uniref:sigma-54 interaction domain-containing protein n=1 Tax=Clostridium sp. TaxID=1506 RepID=UPI003464A9F0
MIIEKDDFYKAILEASHDEIYVTDGRGIAIYCNESFEKNYDMKREDVIGKPIEYLLENEICDKSPLPNVIKHGKAVSIQQTTNKGRILMITATPTFDENGNIAMIVENCRDITELEAMKEDLENTQKEMLRYKQEVVKLRKLGINDVNQFIIRSSKLKELTDIVDRIADVNSNVLITGESGTGKSILAKYIHNNSSRREGAFAKINCATVSETLLESELFGYTSGAFTGAQKGGKIGLVELANGGTLFLDEIGEVPLHLQSKFLDLIQEKIFTPIGSTKCKTIDVRIIAATNSNLQNQVKSKLFREDLYYRLKVVELEIPPLRERHEDIEELTAHYVNKFNIEYNRNVKLSNECCKVLYNYSWPGNIRELQHVVEQLVVTSSTNKIDIKSIPRYILEHMNIKGDNFSMDSMDSINENKDLDEILGDVEKDIIKKYFNKYKSSYKVAQALGISQSRANRLHRKYFKE